uniref:Putative ovule protein n=1 Tax=Solanum chacoense TaxID=4108 RepID=A0A0V0HYM0_SOLCH
MRTIRFGHSHHFLSSFCSLSSRCSLFSSFYWNKEYDRKNTNSIILMLPSTSLITSLSCLPFLSQ